MDDYIYFQVGGYYAYILGEAGNYKRVVASLKDSRTALALPDSIDARALATPSLKSDATPPTTNKAAAFNNTKSRMG